MDIPVLLDWTGGGTAPAKDGPRRDDPQAADAFAAAVGEIVVRTDPEAPADTANVAAPLAVATAPVATPSATPSAAHAGGWRFDPSMPEAAASTADAAGPASAPSGPSFEPPARPGFQPGETRSGDRPPAAAIAPDGKATGKWNDPGLQRGVPLRAGPETDPGQAFLTQQPGGSPSAGRDGLPNMAPAAVRQQGGTAGRAEAAASAVAPAASPDRPGPSGNEALSGAGAPLPWPAQPDSPGQTGERPAPQGPAAGQAPARLVPRTPVTTPDRPAGGDPNAGAMPVEVRAVSLPAQEPPLPPLSSVTPLPNRATLSPVPVLTGSPADQAGPADMPTPPPAAQEPSHKVSPASIGQVPFPDEVPAPGAENPALPRVSETADPHRAAPSRSEGDRPRRGHHPEQPGAAPGSAPPSPAPRAEDAASSRQPAAAFPPAPPTDGLSDTAAIEAAPADGAAIPDPASAAQRRDAASQPPPADQTLPRVPHPAHQIAGIAGQFAGRAVELTLSPEELGGVRMILAPVDGTMTLVISAERADTLDLLRRGADTLVREFRDMGYADVSLSFGAQGQGRSQNSPSWARGPEPEVPPPPSGPRETAAPAAPAPTRRDGRVDLRL